MTITFGSVCSGIEAASVAWSPLGWKAAWLSEIESFPSAVLKHHYPDTANLGDMRFLPEKIENEEIESPDVFCGGTPCQSFSYAGSRKSLDDQRGNLTLTFCEIANAIDDVRFRRNQQPTIVFWENVPGVLSTKDNAFGCFLGALAGEDVPLIPSGGKWTNAGCVYGPKRTVAWRVLDAQYFGVAQRRRRVFVVASARDDFDPAAVLFEFEGLRRDIAPSRKKGENPTGTLRVSAPGSGGQGNDYEFVVAHTLTAHTAIKAPDYQTYIHKINSVRMLTPVECERLQGFPDNYTAIPWRKKPASECPDTPRFKTIGNSWAVPVVRWIGNRINNQII